MKLTSEQIREEILDAAKKAELHFNGVWQVSEVALVRYTYEILRKQEEGKL